MHSKRRLTSIVYKLKTILIDLSRNQSILHFDVSGREVSGFESNQQSLFVRNLTNRRVFFKIKTTNNFTYFAKPFMGVINPEEEFKIEVYCYVKLAKLNQYDKLQVLACEADSRIHSKSDEQLRWFWQSVDENEVQKDIVVELMPVKQGSPNQGTIPNRGSNPSEHYCRPSYREKNVMSSVDSKMARSTYKANDSCQLIKSEFLNQFSSEIKEKYQAHLRVKSEPTPSEGNYKQEYEEMIMSIDEQEKELQRLGAMKQQFRRQLTLKQQSKQSVKQIPRGQLIQIQYAILLVLISFAIGLLIKQ